MHAASAATSSLAAWGEDLADPWQEDADPWAEADSVVSKAEPSKTRKVSLGAGAELLAGSTFKKAKNTFETKGGDPDECRKRWAQPCPRKCKMEGCKAKGIRLADLQALCSCFWKISQNERCQLLQATYGDASQKGPERQKVEYYIGDAQVCFHNFCSKLGSSQNTIRKLMAGQPDMRTCSFGQHSFGSRPRDALAVTTSSKSFTSLQQKLCLKMKTAHLMTHGRRRGAAFKVVL